jgi:hypothetical protein
LLFRSLSTGNAKNVLEKVWGESSKKGASKGSRWWDFASVRLEVWDDMVWLSKGWSKFVEHYSICDGHFLVFKYEDDSFLRTHTIQKRI